MRHLFRSPANEYEHAVVVRDAVKRYPGVVALKGVSLEVPKGEFVLLTGHSGSGKSTMLTLIEGIARPDSGEITVLGRPITAMKEKQVQKLKREHIGVGFQAPLDDRSFSVAANITDAARSRNIDIPNERVIELAKSFGMLDKLMIDTGGLSGGEKLRTGIMRTIAARPSLLLLDEPTGNLDHKGEADTFRLLKQMVDNDGTTILMVTHQPEIAAEYANREFVMNNGHLDDEKIHNPVALPELPARYGQA